jgi:hypothetical protein
VVSKDELLDQVWPAQIVSESVLPRNIRVLRKALVPSRTFWGFSLPCWSSRSGRSSISRSPSIWPVGCRRERI